MSTQTQTGLVPLVEGQQSYNIAFSPAFGAAPSYFEPTVHMPSSSGEIFTVAADRSTLTASGVTVWLSGIPTAASVGGFVNWYALGPFAYAVVNPGTGLNVPQLFHRMGRRTTAGGGDFTRLSMSAQTDLAEAANAALQRLYNALPTYFKEQTQGFALPAPLAITSVGVTQYSKTITGYSFSAAKFGQSVVLDGDATWNQIVGTDALLNPYMGATGTVSGTIYGNAIYSATYPLDRIIGNPQFVGAGSVALLANGELGSWVYAQSVGMPQVSWPQVFGNSQGNAPIMVLRFAPAPSQAYAVNVRLGFWPRRLTLADYENATNLVIPDQFIEAAFIPMCLQELMSTPIWRSTKSDEQVDVRGSRGEAFARNQPATIGTPNNRVYTPHGF